VSTPARPGGPHDGPPRRSRTPRFRKPPLRVFTTTLWEYPSQHYEGTSSSMQGDKDYAGATPSWVIWQLLTRYTRNNDLVVDPMCGSGTTIDVARDLERRALGYDLTPRRPDIFKADARQIPVEDAKADFVFIDPPYSTHIEYSTDPADIGRLDAGGADGGRAYYDAMATVLHEARRVLKDRRYLGVYVSDSWRKRKGGEPGSGAGIFMPIGFELFSILRGLFKPVDIICVVRHNAKLRRGNWHKAAEEGNFYLRGFNYLLVAKKEEWAGSDSTKAGGGTGRPPVPQRH
jgi:DNA modification methylase